MKYTLAKTFKIPIVILTKDYSMKKEIKITLSVLQIYFKRKSNLEEYFTLNKLPHYSMY